MCSMEVYQELKDNILQFKFPARVGVQRLGAASMPGRWRGRGLLEQGGAQGALGNLK